MCLQIGGTEDQEDSQSENIHAKHLKLLNDSSVWDDLPGLPLRRFNRERVTQVDLGAGDPWDGSLSRVLSIVLSIEPGRSRHLGLAKAANRAIHLGFTVILP